MLSRWLGCANIPHWLASMKRWNTSFYNYPPVRDGGGCSLHVVGESVCGPTSSPPGKKRSLGKSNTPCGETASRTYLKQQHSVLCAYLSNCCQCDSVHQVQGTSGDPQMLESRVMKVAKPSQGTHTGKQGRGPFLTHVSPGLTQKPFLCHVCQAARAVPHPALRFYMWGRC